MRPPQGMATKRDILIDNGIQAVEGTAVHISCQYLLKQNIAKLIY